MVTGDKIQKLKKHILHQNPDPQILLSQTTTISQRDLNFLVSCATLALVTRLELNGAEIEEKFSSPLLKHSPELSPLSTFFFSNLQTTTTAALEAVAAAASQAQELQTALFYFLSFNSVAETI